MANEDMNVAAVTEAEKQIVGTLPQIIVTGTVEKPYYEIMYKSDCGEIYLGYSSYKLELVFRWLEEFFGETHAKAVDPESLRPKGRWTENRRKEFSVAIGGDVCWFTYTCSECGGETMNDYQYCPNCGADMTDNKGEIDE